MLGIQRQMLPNERVQLRGCRRDASTEESCLGPAATAASLTIAESPPAGTGYYYLVRGSNACGTGPYGFQTSGSEQTSAACP